MLRYCCMFSSSATLNTYLKHLRWAHRFLRLSCRWDTDVLAQTRRGAKKCDAPPKPKLALQAPDVAKLIDHAVQNSDREQACLLAVARQFLLRVPSEALPLEVRGHHSQVDFDGDDVIITLTSRKNRRNGAVLRRSCSCRASGRKLCAYHWLK